jgi:uncharacterized membrane protein
MPLSPLGVLHTIIGGGAVLAGFYLLWRNRQISMTSKLGWFYLAATLFTAASSLGIYKHGGFGPAHILAVLTIVAAIAGTLASAIDVLGGFKKYVVALCYSSTMLFHLIPTATEILTRFPADSPLVSSFEDPLLQGTFLVILVTFVILLALQMNWLRKQP